MGQILLTMVSVVVARVLDAFLPGAGTILQHVLRGARIGATRAHSSGHRNT
jgi:hypothetical protein